MLQCNAEWHLRENPRAYLIYTMALSISKGTGSFYVSQPQIAAFFGWDLKTVRAAFKALRASGLITLLHGGSGGNGHPSLANVYSVTIHSKLPKDKYPCRPLPETGTLFHKADQAAQGKTGIYSYQKPSTPSQDLAGGGYQKPVPYSTNNSTYNSSAAIESGKNRYPQTDAIASKNNTASPKGKSSLPEDFTPNDEDRALADKLGIDIEDSLTRFRLYHKGKGSRMADWHCALQGWLMNAPKFKSAASPSTPATTGSLTQNMKNLMKETSDTIH
jgi:hypothetical protein